MGLVPSEGKAITNEEGRDARDFVPQPATPRPVHADLRYVVGMSSLIPDPEQPNAYLIGDSAEELFGAQVGPAVLKNVHPAAACAGEPCVVHNPSDHHMRNWRLNWRGDRGLMERICPHGIGHPDPDSMAFEVRQGRSWQGVHGCDGCCGQPEPDISEV